MTASGIRRLDLGRFVSFLLFALAITLAVGAISIGTLFVSGALYFPLVYYPDAVANEGIAWTISAVYLVVIVTVATLVTAGKTFVVALVGFVGISLAASICIHVIMAGLGFDFRTL